MKKQNFFSITGIFALALLFMACEPEQLEELPAAANIQNGADTSQHQALEPSRRLEGWFPLQYKWPNPLPANTLVKGLDWSANDYVRLNYNEKGQVAQRYSQWQYVQGDPTKIKKFISNFRYDAQGRLAEVSTTEGPVMQYQYQGDWIEKVRKIIPETGVVLEEVSYSNDKRRIVQEIRRYTNPFTGEPTQLKSVFGYDARG
ncbi:MAG: hypothetical protein L6Q97_25620, partial [Thermoanaerobaculia bacterium]|nr:hypothetical protein [Thermoanaerobaculia bacterium]